MHRPTLSQLEAFVRIVDAGTFVRAAGQLNVTQPTISQRVRELEENLGGRLFERHGPRISLSPMGMGLLHLARRVLAASDELQQEMQNMDALTGTLRLGMTETFARICLVPLLRDLESDYPQLQTSVLVGDSGTMESMLRQELLDIAVLVEAGHDPSMRMETAGFNEIAWFASPSIALPQHVAPRDLADHLILIPAAASKVHTTVLDWFGNAGLTPRRLCTCNSVTVMMQVVTSGLALTVQPVRLFSEEVRRGQLRRISARPVLPRHRVSIAYQTRTLGPRVAEIAALKHKLIDMNRLFVA